MRKEILEVLVFLMMIISYVSFRKYIAGRAIFILPVIFFLLGYVIYSLNTDPNLLREFGIRFDNIIQACILSALFFILFATIIFMVSKTRRILSPPPSFYYLLFLYPIWGFTQQFLFQSFFHTRLIRLGLAPWSILIVAIVYAGVHLSSAELVFTSFVGGIISSYIFLKCPNIITLGIAHGILGAMIYYLILGKDVFKSFIRSTQ